jgi:dolichyl-phosphate-mannose-protein mannosyltransferase
VGNPIVWWISSAAVGLYLAVRGILVLRAKRGFRDLQQRKLV